ncbi:glycoprotease family protein [Dokdonia sp. MED134]|uniref:tRNA (adenosine(37)-N6)-threonylcarbamoyltransferase complex dimerization subunit type 1 TsaB n=1 Tax=Dokdonia sp. MED134 TaxID=313590 RepID=UPI0001F81598|nr:tRNA (adenosine(37)-N6)-threonylcarbamoyltransferase complex dimerization subunit type 1 TsaB [Dokdonia sp. MED134]EAQ38536.2 glycoprotease family protein [Dokdonia sp. MED134]
MTHILCLETATTNCSVALSINGEVVMIQEDNAKKYSHAERLHTFIKEVLDKAGVAQEKLDAIAVSKGPGSYTGLRIGVSAAKGLCAALDIPLIAVETLRSLSRKQNLTHNELVAPMLDARRMEVYSAIYDSEGNVIRGTEAQILDETSFTEYLDKSIVHFIGNGVEKFQEVCTHPNARFVTSELPSAAQMAGISNQKFQEGLFEDVAYFEPYYLKDFIAGKPKKK